VTDVEVRVDTNGLPALFTLAGAGIATDMAHTVYRTGAAMRTQVRAGASGRPGPRVQTGDYRRSITQTNALDGDVPVALIFTNAPQGPRLEYGFVGADALGRHFRQPPYPHWRPAAAKTQQLFEAECARLVARAIAKITGRTP
jgi:hypothetical protein